jgi:hypothetical protein
MKNRKLYKKLGTLLGQNENVDQEHIKKLRKVLKKLKKNQQAMTACLEGDLPEEEKRKLERDIAVLKLQREKGVAVYKRLKQAVNTGKGPTQPAS